MERCLSFSLPSPCIGPSSVRHNQYSHFQQIHQFFYSHANPLHDFSVEIFMFLTATTVTNPELLAIVIYYILELTSKYRLNIFQLCEYLFKTYETSMGAFYQLETVHYLSQRNIQIIQEISSILINNIQGPYQSWKKKITHDDYATHSKFYKLSLVLLKGRNGN